MCCSMVALESHLFVFFFVWWLLESNMNRCANSTFHVFVKQRGWNYFKETTETHKTQSSKYKQQTKPNWTEKSITNIKQWSLLVFICSLFLNVTVRSVSSSHALIPTHHRQGVRVGSQIDVKKKEPLFWCKNSFPEKDKEHMEFKGRWHALNIPTTGLHKPFNSICSAAVQIIWSRLDCRPPAQGGGGGGFGRSALAVEPAQFHWASAQITNH